MQFASMFSIVYIMLPIVCFTIGSYLLVIETIEIVSSDFQTLCGKMLTESDKGLKQLIGSIVSDVSDMKQLSLNIAILIDSY